MVPSPVSSKRLSCARVERCWNGKNAPVNKIHSYAWIYFPSKKEQNSLLTPTLSPLFWNCDLVLDCYCCTSTRVKISSHSPSIKMPGRRSLHPPLPLPWPRHHASGEGISYSKPNGRITWKSPWNIHSMHFFLSHVFPKKQPNNSQYFDWSSQEKNEAWGITLETFRFNASFMTRSSSAVEPVPSRSCPAFCQKKLARFKSDV